MPEKARKIGKYYFILKLTRSLAFFIYKRAASKVQNEKKSVHSKILAARWQILTLVQILVQIFCLGSLAIS